MEFDSVSPPTESTIVRYFEKGLKPSIRAEINQDASYLDNYKELVAKVVRAEEKAGLQPSSYIWETDQQVPWGNWPAHITTHKVLTQGVMKNHCGDNSKARASISTSTQKVTTQRTNDVESFEKTWKEKKKSRRNRRRNQEDSTPAIGVNTTDVLKRIRDRPKKSDPANITCYRCNKKGYYTNKCIKPKNQQ